MWKNDERKNTFKKNKVKILYKWRRTMKAHAQQKLKERMMSN